MIVGIVAHKHEIEGLRSELSKIITTKNPVRLQFFELGSLETDIAQNNSNQSPTSSLSEKIRKVKPDVIIIGQTPPAEAALSQLRLIKSPLIVRFSMFYGENGPVYGKKTPSEAGYHLDIPKRTESVASFLQNSALINAIHERDYVSLKSSLPEEALCFDRLKTWSGGSTPPLDFPIRIGRDTDNLIT